MDKGGILFFINIMIGNCYIIYDSTPSKNTKLEESFGGFMNWSLVRFEYEKSPLHTIVYGGTGTGKTYFIRQYLKIYSVQNQDLRSNFADQNQNRDQSQNQDQNPNQNQDQAKNIVIVCKDDRDWIDPESNKFYTGFHKCDINMITKTICINCAIVPDDMGHRLNKDIAYYFF